MRAIGLFLALACAHLLMLAGREVPLSPWTLPAYLWQDAAVALIFAALMYLVRAPKLIWAVYALVIAYAAINVAVARVLPSPLTPTMVRAARGTLSDSILEYVSLVNIGLILLPVAIGAAAPFLLRRVRWSRFAPVALVLGCAIVATGPYAASRIDTAGWHRNAYGALLPSRLPSAGTGTGTGTGTAVQDWRESPFGPGMATDLSRFRGAAAGRNVVLVILESAGAQYLELYGADSDPMPNLTALARHGVLFESAYAAYPESIKGLFAVLCSRSPALGLAVELHTAARCQSLAQELRGAGYRTGLFHSGRFGYLGMQGIVDGRGFDMLADAGTISGRMDSSFGIDEPSAVEAMLEWIDQLEPDVPFFLNYLPIAGHHPYATIAPGPYPPTDERNRYLNALHEADAALGQLLSGLDDRGLLDETLFVIFGDHGEAFGQHPDNIAHSFFLYDENVRVPYLLAAPGLITEATGSSRTISVVDTAPTVLDLLGLPIPVDYEGRSALDARQQMALFLTDYARNKLGLVDGCWKLIFDIDSQDAELYDLCSDPGEQTRLADREAERVLRYTRHLERWAAAGRSALRE